MDTELRKRLTEYYDKIINNKSLIIFTINFSLNYLMILKMQRHQLTHKQLEGLEVPIMDFENKIVKFRNINKNESK